MDLPEAVSIRKFKDFSKQQKEELYETLLELREAIEELPKKSLRKTLELALAVLVYKGEQVTDLQEQLENKDKESLESQHERLLDENEKLKRMVANLEDNKTEHKNKIKELTEEIFSLQARLREVANTEVSDKDSSDPLSELDKQETLLRNINTKNKHIKRLLKEIESLQNQNIEQSKTILTLEKDLKHGKEILLQLKADKTLLESEKKALKESMQDLNAEMKRLEGNITYLEDEREKSEHDLKDFIEKLEIKAVSWKRMLEEKDKQLKKYKTKKETKEDVDSQRAVTEPKADSEQSDEQEEHINKLQQCLESRDILIEQLEGKLKMMAEEMIASTKLMNKLTTEREEERNPRKPRPCCKIIEMALKASNEKCEELSDMLQKAEEECCLKAKQAMETVKALTAYQKGEDGLMTALRKCSSLENKLQSRDKQIRALVMELNSMHEIAQENNLLRKRLNIPEDVVLTAKKLQAKERSKEKMIEKLTLKLRASEEMRLRLQMEKSDLRKQLMALTKGNSPLKHSLVAQVSPTTPTTPTPIKHKHNTTLDYLTSPSASKEVGEIEDSINSKETSLLVTVCSQCQGNLKVELQEPLHYETHEGKHQEIQQENELLRQGMLEILEKLREYDDCSNQIIIDKELLSKLIQTLKNTNSTFDTPKRLREQLAVIRTREKALEELLSKQTTHTPQRELPTEDLNSIESVREDGEIKEITTDYDIQLPAEYLDSSTRPTTPTKSLNIPYVPTPPPAALEKQQAVAEMCLSEKRTLKTELEELKIFKKYYEELKLHMHANEMEIMQACAELTEQIVHLEQDFIRERKSYEYMREDFNENLSMLKQQQIESIQIQAELKKELTKSQALTEKLKQDFQTYKNLYNYSCDDYKALQQSLNESQMQLAIITEELLCSKSENSIKIPDLCLDYGIIKEDLQLEFITQQEYENQKQMINTFETQKLEMQRKTTQLETLLEIAQEQILSQQKLLNEITDTQVNLRHTVADLQSSTEDKLLIAKIQRDLDAAKLELGHVRNERDSLKIKFENLEQDLVTSKHLMENLNKNFHFECQNNNLKIRFLQKSLYYLKEKYAKFTPLVFLSNFAYAYQKFLKKKSTLNEENHPNMSDLLNDDIVEIIKTAAKEHNLEMQESQQVIKLVKAETQCKLYEEQLKQWEKKCFDLEKDLHDIKLKMANETEHWRTIDALFEIEEKQKSLQNSAMQKLEKLLTQEIGCNTDNMPIPAERTRRLSKVMVDKNISPIQTPFKNHTFNDTTTQTDDSEFCLQTTQPEEQEKKSEEHKSIVTRETSEAQIQTSRDLIPQDSKAIQTLQEQEEEQKNSKKSPTIKAVQEKTAKETPEKRVINKTNAEREAVEKLIKTEESLSQAEIKIQELEEKLIQQQKHLPVSSPVQQNQPTNLQSDVIEKTILSFHTLLTEKDKSISKYQDILLTEREENHFNLTKLHNEIEDLKSTIVNLNYNIKTKDTEIFDLKTQLESVSVRRNSNEKLDLATHLMAGAEENIDNSLNEMTDEKIEEMFEENVTPSIKATEPSDDLQATAKEKHELEHNKEESNENLFKQLKEFKEKSTYWESSFKLKEEEIQILKEKIKFLQDREKSTNVTTYNTEIKQLRSLLEEKDKHINELMDTLNNFHDDQQRYINDSSNYSADQIAKLASDLTRTEATNKIYQTQIEALRKQLTNLTQREKQARELNQSLRNQLIKRPIVSIKTELNARVKNENLQKKIQQLELDLEDAKAEIQRQKNIIDSRRARSANEVGLWEKQKRWQQNAEKFKTKLEETEIMLEKTRALLQSARNTINRLEKDKQILEAKLSRITQQNVQHSMKCCRTPSCPNLQINQTSSVGSVTAAKYTPSETPETYTGASSECSSPGHGPLPICNKLHYNHVTSTLQNPQNDIIEALKARLEMQQRKIIALELEGKGSNVLTTEIEKIQEKLSSVEAQNIRLEAKNLQLQLDNDLLRQGDGTERLQKRIKHLEDYIIALKEEMASAEARKELCKCSGIKLNTQIGQSVETTILSLRNLVEKLQAENKYLKDVRKSCESKTSTEISNNDSARFQQMYTDSQNKISALQLELKLQSKCPHCENKGSKQKALDTQTHDELKYVKEQLVKKSQLLQKAKVLLARAAAKEKVLKEQLAMWKRKCFELQNVPVIDEISE